MEKYQQILRRDAYVRFFKGDQGNIIFEVYVDDEFLTDGKLNPIGFGSTHGWKKWVEEQSRNENVPKT